MSPFLVDADGVRLAGWTRGSGPPVLLLHGGPGLSYDYLDDVADDLGDGFTVAAFQQRGVAPSQEEGPFDVADHVADAGRVLDHLGWDRATVVGHSWGGHLALHLAAALPHRLERVVCVDPLGAVGDGGSAAFEDEMFARTPEDVRDRARELDERGMRGEGTEEEQLESLRLVWPAYFPRWDDAPPMPPTRLSVACYAESYASLVAELPALEAALPDVTVPVTFVVGEGSPMPASASTDTAERLPRSRVVVVPGAGHFPWLDVPGCLRAALEDA